MRALTDAERRSRRDALAGCALALFADRGYSGLTVEAVARAAGLAKGTVFQAFTSKEDLFLHGVRLRFEAWFERLAAVDLTGANPAVLAAATLESLRADPLLLPLLALVGPVFEEGCSPEAVVGFKQALAGGMGRLAGVWGPRFPSVRPESWGTVFLEVYALTVGAWAVGEASSTVRKALEGRPDLAVFVTRFDDLFLPLLEARLALLFPR